MDADNRAFMAFYCPTSRHLVINFRFVQQISGSWAATKGQQRFNLGLLRAVNFFSTHATIFLGFEARRQMVTQIRFNRLRTILFTR